MYGIVNNSLEDLVCTYFGKEKWLAIKEKSGVETDYFLSAEPYDDEITVKLTKATSEIMKVPLNKIMESFGEWWVLNTAKQKYGPLLQAGGNNLKQFLINLPSFHNRIMLMYPKLRPPEFQISNLKENSIFIHYYSSRTGLREFVRGLLQGLGLLFETPVTIELLQSREDGKDHEIFKVSW